MVEEPFDEELDLIVDALVEAEIFTKDTKRNRRVLKMAMVPAMKEIIRRVDASLPDELHTLRNQNGYLRGSNDRLNSKVLRYEEENTRLWEQNKRLRVYFFNMATRIAQELGIEPPKNIDGSRKVYKAIFGKGFTWK